MLRAVVTSTSLLSSENVRHDRAAQQLRLKLRHGSRKTAGVPDTAATDRRNVSGSEQGTGYSQRDTAIRRPHAKQRHYETALA